MAGKSGSNEVRGGGAAGMKGELYLGQFWLKDPHGNLHGACARVSDCVPMVFVFPREAQEVWEKSNPGRKALLRQGFLLEILQYDPLEYGVRLLSMPS